MFDRMNLSITKLEKTVLNLIPDELLTELFRTRKQKLNIGKEEEHTITALLKRENKLSVLIIMFLMYLVGMVVLLPVPICLVHQTYTDIRNSQGIQVSATVERTSLLRGRYRYEFDGETHRSSKDYYIIPGISDEVIVDPVVPSHIIPVNIFIVLNVLCGCTAFLFYTPFLYHEYVIGKRITKLIKTRLHRNS